MRFSLGFTLLELLTTLTVIAIMLGFGIPSLSRQTQANQVKTAANGLLEAMDIARSKAVSTNKRVTLKKLDEWNNGWEIFIDRNNDGQLNDGETVILHHEKLAGVRILVNGPLRNNVSYVGSGESRLAGGSDGGGFQAGTFVVCPQTKGEGYRLILARGGRVRSTKVSVDECGP